MNYNILKFQYEEIVYILLILSSDMSYYSKEVQMEFAEVLYRLLDYSDKNFLLKLKLINKNINQEFIESFIKLDDIAKKFYKNKWFDNINYYNSYIIKSKLIAEKLLVIMNEEKIEPLEYLNNNMNC